jgi:hypothetical protein
VAERGELNPIILRRLIFRGKTPEALLLGAASWLGVAATCAYGRASAMQGTATVPAAAASTPIAKLTSSTIRTARTPPPLSFDVAYLDSFNLVARQS